MRVLCVCRHVFLSEHLCRFFRAAGAECEPAVGAADVARVAARWEPSMIVSDVDILSSAVLDEWANDPALASIPVLAVSLTHRPEEAPRPVSSRLAPVVFLASLVPDQVRAILAAASGPGGVSAPAGFHVTAALPQAVVG